MCETVTSCNHEVLEGVGGLQLGSRLRPGSGCGGVCGHHVDPADRLVGGCSRFEDSAKAPPDPLALVVRCFDVQDPVVEPCGSQGPEPNGEDVLGDGGPQRVLDVVPDLAELLFHGVTSWRAFPPPLGSFAHFAPKKIRELKPYTQLLAGGALPPSRYEEDVPAQEAQARPHARISRADADPRRASDDQAASQEGTLAPDGLGHLL